LTGRLEPKKGNRQIDREDSEQENTKNSSRSHLQRTAQRTRFRNGIIADNSSPPILTLSGITQACAFYSPEIGSLCAIGISQKFLQQERGAPPLKNGFNRHPDA
jgi:hypothetical protein